MKYVISVLVEVDSTNQAREFGYRVMEMANADPFVTASHMQYRPGVI